MGRKPNPCVYLLLNKKLKAGKSFYRRNLYMCAFVKQIRNLNTNNRQITNLETAQIPSFRCFMYILPLPFKHLLVLCPTYHSVFI
jgi:hypothetical protein